MKNEGLSNFRFKIYLSWLELGCKIHDIKKKILAKTLCKLGYHKVGRRSSGVKNNKRERKTSYLYCANCNYLFFSTDKDMKTYDWLQKYKNKDVEKMMKLMCRKEGGKSGKDL